MLLACSKVLWIGSLRRNLHESWPYRATVWWAQRWASGVHWSLSHTCTSAWQHLPSPYTLYPLLGEFSNNFFLGKPLLAWSDEEGVMLWVLIPLLVLVNRITTDSLRFHVWSRANNLINTLSISFLKVFLARFVEAQLPVKCCEEHDYSKRMNKWQLEATLGYERSHCCSTYFWVTYSSVLLSAVVSNGRQEQQGFKVPRLL